MKTPTLALALALGASIQGTAWSGAVPSTRAAQSDVGFLDVSSDPPAKIIIDEVDTGRVTPQPHLELKAGHHKLTLVTLDGAHKRALGFTIEAGETRKFTIHLAS